ncbi:MAG TPA: membrane integrity-associated transporter subunit PqiC [Gammaproteobacteria bacterium]|nr:membrane integrity-associated transporter subunit PqiC [Gammaproteobacteria bacterium]
MKIIKIFIYTFGVVLCHACASSGEQVRYYRLTPDTLIENNKYDNHVTRVIISPVHISKILQQEGIVTQTGKNEVNIALYHRWANPLDEAIAIALLKNINNRTDQYHIEKFTTQINQRASYILYISIEKFDIRDDASVNISGSYSVLDRGNTSIVEQSFNIKKTLIENGYSHAVEKLKQTLVLLAEKILTGLDEASKDAR